MKILHVLIILLMILFCKKSDAQLDSSIVWINLEGSLYLAIPASNADEIVKATESLKTYHTWYWEAEKKDLIQDSIIATYIDITGVQAVDLKQLRELSANKKSIDASILLDKNNEINKEHTKGNKKLGVGFLIGTITGIVLGILL